MSVGDSSTIAEQVEKNKIKLTFKVTPAEFAKGLQYAYNRNKKEINIQGFRKGKAPRKMIEKMYGKDIFYEEALNHVLPESYEKALQESGVKPVYRPTIDVQEMDEQTGATVTAEVYVKPEVEIENYHGLTYTPMNAEPTEEDIQNTLQAEREKNSRTVSVDRLSEMGDILTINFTGYIDGVPFEGGNATDFELTLGSKSFIDTFEEQLVGYGVGDDIKVNVTFPEKYQSEDLQGKPALFEVEILDIQAKELPELDDDFAQDVSEFETLAELREDITEKIRVKKEHDALNLKRANIIQQLVGKATMEVPQAMYEARIDQIIEDLRMRLMQQGMELEQYVAYMGGTVDTLRQRYQDQAKEDVDARLVLEALAKKENMQATDEDLKDYMLTMITPPTAENTDSNPDEKAQIEQQALEILAKMNEERKEELLLDILVQRALEFVVDKSVALEVVD
ncbi:MAG: trigger factor [Defluviitaleaceae bacterium]|nr:trigger factor [Defluviitaleaceae bacterium]